MATTPMPWDRYAAQQQPQSSQAPWEKYAGQAAQSSSDITSNPNGEGTYKMVGRKGPVNIPYGRVEEARQGGYLFLGARDRERYQKNAAADPNRDNRNDIQKSFDENTKTSPDEPLLETGIKSVVNAVGSPFIHPVQTLKGLADFIPADPDLPSSVSPTGDRNPVVQGAKNVRNDYREGGAAYAGAKLAGQVFGSAALGEAGGAALDAATSGTKAVTGQNYTSAHAKAFEGAIAPATAMGKNFIPQDVTPEALSPIRATAARMEQGTPIEQGIVKTAKSSKTPPMQRIAAYQNIVQNALSDLESQHAPVLASVAQTPVDTSPIVSRLQSLKSATMAPADASAIDELVDRVRNAKTIGDLNTFRSELNKENAPIYRMSQVQQGRSGVTAEATDDLAGWVRNAYYDNLEQATGQDFAPLKRQEANLFTTQEALQNQQSPLSRAEATFAAPTTLREKAGNFANVVKDPKTTVTQTFLRESPATKVATLLQKSLDDLPEHTPSTGNAPPSSNAGTSPTQPTLGKGPIPTIQATTVNPFPSPEPSGLPAPGPEAAPGQPQISAPPRISQLPSGPQGWRLSSASDVPTQTPPSPPPPFNPGTARTRIQPLMPSRPTVIPPRGAIAVSPSGEATLPAKGLPAPEVTAKPAALSGKALWAQKGAEKMATHGVSTADIDALNATSKGRQLLVIASSLSPGSQAMKNLVRQIPGVIGK